MGLYRISFVLCEIRPDFMILLSPLLFLNYNKSSILGNFATKTNPENGNDYS